MSRLERRDESGSTGGVNMMEGRDAPGAPVRIRIMQFMSLSRRRVDAFPPEAFTPELAAHEGVRVKELYSAGILRQIWMRGDIPGASILWEAASEEEVRSAIDSLPIFKAGMLEIIALIPLKPYPGFGPPK